MLLRVPKKTPKQANKQQINSNNKKEETKKYKIKNYLNETWLLKVIDHVTN